MVEFKDLVGKTILKIEGADKGSEEIRFITRDASYKLYHFEECCETVSVEDICGDISDLIGNPILLAKEVESERNEGEPIERSDESYTWTFYKLATIKGSVTIRWYGSSNGYYSEGVDFKEIIPELESPELESMGFNMIMKSDNALSAKEIEEIFNENPNEVRIKSKRFIARTSIKSI